MIRLIGGPLDEHTVDDETAPIHAPVGTELTITLESGESHVYFCRGDDTAHHLRSVPDVGLEWSTPRPVLRRPDGTVV